ncbi:MerR family transcriptional regulator [Paenibacillus sp. FSL L8-0470]|uniref:MerR family transcriptional regulator n=1 Tax=Paenibacillus sp. FSL L8-0470 TaxID=2954688 RepID=UPI0030FADA9B
MKLEKITGIMERFGVTSRTLRYYEQVGILQSTRQSHEKYRYYDQENINRLQQILVLRKMQIPIKEIIRIYESRDMKVLVQTFVSRIQTINDEIATLSELKAIVNDFLEAMLDNGISHISALPLIYEKVEHQFGCNKKAEIPDLERLSKVSEKLVKLPELSIISLPPMRVLSSRLKGTESSDSGGLWDYMSSNQIPFGAPGSHHLFEYQQHTETIIIQKIDDNFQNTSIFEDYIFEGGLFAMCSVFVENDLGEIQYQMIHSFDDNAYYEVDFQHGGVLRHDTLVESVLSPDSGREKINLYLPVKKRLPDTSDIEQNQQLESVTFAEIEQANPVLKEYPVDFHQMTPIYNPHYQVLDNGEAEFICWISARMLNTNVAVKLPFRVDIVFMADSASEAYGYGADEGSLWFSHNNHTFCINAENSSESSLSKHAILFDQPIMGNRFIFPETGMIKYDEYNTFSWIIGEKHFSVVINGEVRYCGVNFPYMNMDLHLGQPAPIFIGSNGQGKKLFRSITISQLKSTPKINVKKGALVMEVKASNNRLPKIHPMVTPHYGENYWFNGCAGFVMECLGEPDYDYWFFAGLTGENFTQVYSHNHFRGDGVTDYRLSEKGNHGFIEDVFGKCGYASSFVPLKQILSNREMYVQTLMAYIDKGIPVILNDHGNNPHNRPGWGVLVGYEDYGKTLLYMGGDATEPDRIPVKDLLPEDYIMEGGHCKGWIFLGEKKKEMSLADIYRNRILSLPDLLTFESNHYCFGAKAFRDWADSIENGYFERMNPEEYDDWGMHKVYVCNLATNSGGCRGFLETAQKLNPDLIFIEQIMDLYRQTGHYWNDQNGEDLEALGGGFNANLNTLQDKEKRTTIAAKIREFAVCMDQVVAIVNDFKH